MKIPLAPFGPAALLAGIVAIASAATAPWARVELETGNAIGVLKANGETKPALSITNATDRPRSFSLGVTLENFEGEKRPLSAQACDLAPRGAVSCPLPVPNKLGIWRVHYTLTPRDAGGMNAQPDAGVGPLAGTRSFAYMQPAGPTSGSRAGFRFGVAGWFASGAEGPRQALAIATCGVDIVRCGGIWQAAEPREGEWRWDRVDEIVRQLGEQHLEPQVMLSYCPSWAALPIPEAMQKRIDAGELNPVRGDHLHAPRLDAWWRFVAEAGRRYRGRVRYWEVWNEPDWMFYYGTTPHYLAMLKIAHEELKRVDSGNQVMTGGFAVAATMAPSAAPNPFLQLNKRPNPDMQDVVLRDGQDDFDLHAHHEHGPFEKFARQIDGVVVPMRQRYLKTPKPLYFTETGAAIRNTGKDGDGTVHSEQEQARTLVEKIVFAWSRGAVAYNWWNIVDSAEGEYGLFTKEFQPKAAYVAYNTLVSVLRGKTFVHQAGSPEKRWAFVFTGEREKIVVAWPARRTAGGETDLQIETDATRAELVDLMGNHTPLEIAGGRVRASLSADPCFVILHGAEKPPVVAKS